MHFDKKLSIFIVGSERSGSNLLRTLLGNHSEVDAPVAPHFLDVFSPYLMFYGSLRLMENKKRLITDMLKLANHEYNDWQFNLEIQDDELKDLKGFIEIYDFIYSKKAQKEGKIHYVSKGNNIFNYVFKIQSYLKNAKFLYLHRDPRDHVASWVRTPLFLLTPFDIIQKWNREQTICLELMHYHGLQMLAISYEQLIESPQEVITKILHYLGLPVEESCFQTNSQNKESGKNEFWKNLSKPIIKENSKKYLKYLSRSDLHIVESIAKKNMIELGYTNFETEANWVRKKYRLFGTSLKIKRYLTKKKYKDFREKEMNILMSKRGLIDSMRREIMKINKAMG